MRILACSLLIVAGFTAHARAQSTEPRGSVGGIVGGGRTWDDEGSLGTGVAAGGRVDWRIFGNTSVEGSVDSLSHDRSGGFFEAEGRTVFIGISLVQRFGSSAARPYILGGYHLAQHDGSTTFDDMRTERESTSHGFHFGGGVAIALGRRFEIGPEARFYMIQPDSGSDPALAYWIGGRLGIRF
jgi:hypothetical protein